MSALIVDVREPYEFASGCANGAINMPLSNLQSDLAKLKGFSKDTPMILYCNSGGRSRAAIHHLSQMGYTNLTNGINKSQVNSTLK